MSADRKKKPNPFYALLLVVGIAFTITACAYVTMATKLSRPEEASLGDQRGAALMLFLDQRGAALLMAELALLGVLTVAAIGTDEYWSARGTESSEPGNAATKPKTEESR